MRAENYSMENSNKSSNVAGEVGQIWVHWSPPNVEQVKIQMEQKCPHRQRNWWNRINEDRKTAKEKKKSQICES
jgi:hypothetical protein